MPNNVLLYTARLSEDAIACYIKNKVLFAEQPQINPEEEQLPSQSRTILAQLRSGWCCLLNAYLSRNNSESDNAFKGRHTTSFWVFSQTYWLNCKISVEKSSGCVCYPWKVTNVKTTITYYIHEIFHKNQSIVCDHI